VPVDDSVDQPVPERVCQAEAVFSLGWCAPEALAADAGLFDRRYPSGALGLLTSSLFVPVVVASLREVAIVLVCRDCSQHIPSRGTAQGFREQLCRSVTPGRCGLI